ncbi:LamG domain-containing protein [Marinifilum fragile]|uniref:LamG domain-containing protein n=1 Tax=Marinifilum fragile TaxID=570161 RepID=UPI0006D192BB|nr:LamG domain-containing protein [Marinifilum fragile]
MKAIKLNIKSWSFLAAFLMVFTFTACDDDDNKGGNFNTASIETLITEAETLIETTEEGINAGDQKPGSKAELQSVIDWVRWKIENAENQEDISDAAVKLQRYIDIFKANIVAVAMPWIQQENETWIQISDNIKPIFKESFTIETQIYVVDLNQKGYSNNIFATEQDGPDSGFVIRYFNDGVIHLNVGTADGWRDVKTDPGVMKSGEWMQIAFVNEITSQKLYVNGVEVLSQTQTYLPGADKSFVIGNGPTWTDRVVNAVVKDVRVWKGARTDSEIADNKTATLTGTEANLEMFLPLSADLGSEFKDVTGNYTAKFQGKIEWVAEPPVIVLDKTKLEAAIVEITEFKAEVVEGDQDGDYPVGTIAYIDELIADANEALAKEGRQTALDEKAEGLQSAIKLINSMLVADTDGILVDRDVPSAIGLRITPNYTPQGDYTVEFNVKVKSLFGYGTGEFFNNGEYGVWVYGYDELTEENVLKSGGLWNFTNAGNGWQGPKTDPLVMKTGEWQHVALVHDDTARTTKIFVDGVEKAVFEDIGAPNVSGWGEMWLGNGWGKMDGYIKDFRLWDVARDAADLDSEITGTETGLNVYLPLNRVKGVKFTDETGNYKAHMRGISWNVVE